MSDATASGGRLGRYHLVEPLGGGANGEVHRAKVYGVAGFERQFAVKKFFPHVALNARFAQALSVAARAYGSLEHPRIARLAEFGVSAGHTFTATELVPGIDAARLLAETLAGGGTIPAGSALSLVSQAARAVGYAHGRGISHLGVAPTNLVITPEGEVKITDIGVLGACLPDRPAHDGRFVTRVHYLAPEQLTNEPASAATDVFSLGLIAYELVTGERAFVGASPEDVAQAILTGQPREPQLPRPIMRVLQRCLARSPYERFPDARALADALDAALRVSPVPGTRGEISELVGIALQRIALLNEQQLSGALSLNLPTSSSGSMRADTIADRADGHDQPTVPFQREPDQTLPELHKTPATTMQGMAPPPIPVPQGVSGPIRTSPAFPAGPFPTLQGVPPAVKPSRPPTGGLPPPIPARATTARLDTSGEATPPPVPRRTPPGGTSPAPTASQPIARRTPQGMGSEPVPPRDPSRRIPAAPTSDRFATSDPTTADGRRPPTGSHPIELQPLPQGRRATTGEPIAPPPHRRDSTGEPVEAPGPLGHLRVATPPEGMPTAPGGPPASYATFQGTRQASGTEHVERSGGGGKRTGLKIALAVGALAIGVGGSLIAWQYLAGGDEPAPKQPVAGSAARDAATVASATPDAAAPVTDDDAATAGATPGDGATVATAGADAAGPVELGADAATVAATTPDAAATVPPAGADAAVVAAPSDELVVDTTPSGARVFLDGADKGTTPVTLPGTSDRHSIALVLPGHAPYIAELDGKGKFTIALEEVTPSGGPAGIKLKCKEKDRYVVFLDNKPTGQLCPTERLEVEMGEHLVEIYDLVTETRRQYPANVKETRLSLRIKVDY